MSNSEGTLEARVAVLEEKMVVVQRDTAAARVLGAGADRDVADFRAELRAHTRVLDALRVTQLEQATKLDAHYAEHKADTAELKADVAALRTEFRTELAVVKADTAELKTGLAEVKADVTEIKIGIARIATLFPSITPQDTAGN